MTFVYYEVGKSINSVKSVDDFARKTKLKINIENKYVSVGFVANK